ncbi:disease resistance protein At4g27190 [Gossypium hirsutum]|uniref:Disease resistance protein At4g27190 n=1 Tax=Gossypium hirsutum TaxID=3635 RepID=A0A1U8M824_GOSHI|nr:disease resistance protein At4g27190-like [Gossypium hirsutum]
MAKEDIWNYLMSDEIGMIGEFNIPDLQEKLADALNIVDRPESEPERVAELMEKLGQRRYVLILDDVWKKFSLAEVGIPKPTSSNVSKLVLTVCRSIDCKVVKVLPLSHEESMNLFLEHAGHGVLKVPSLKEILGNIARECGGLPLSIAVIAGSMKGIYDIAEWRNALRELRDYVRSVKGTDIEIYERLKFSFDCLGELKIQSCFLYCSLYPEDYKIPKEELVKYWIDEEFLGTGSREELYDRGHTILNKLIDNSMLEKARDDVKMHDVMRDTALYIKSSGPRFMVKSGIGLKELPTKQEWGEDLEKISIMMNNVSEIPPYLSPNCKVLSTLLLQKNESLQSIPESFFQHMHRLSILDLSYTNIEQLPNSVLNLEKLKALVLRGCYNLRYVPSLEKLEALRKLDLRRTAVEKVPEGLEMLSNLTYLNLCTQSLKKLPVAIIPRLSCLQCLVLYVESSRVKMNGFDATRLTKLEIFEGRFTELIDFNAYTKSIQGLQLTSYLLVMPDREKEGDEVLEPALWYVCNQIHKNKDQLRSVRSVGHVSTEHMALSVLGIDITSELRTCWTSVQVASGACDLFCELLRCTQIETV